MKKYYLFIFLALAITLSAQMQPPLKVEDKSGEINIRLKMTELQHAINKGLFNLYENHTSTDGSQKMLDFLQFCDGHIQRGMNVSWINEHYLPYGEREEDKENSDKPLLADNSSGISKYIEPEQTKGKLDINIEVNKHDYYQGQVVPLFITMKNTGTDTLILNNKDLRISIITGEHEVDYPFEIQEKHSIPPGHSYKYFWYLGESTSCEVRIFRYKDEVIITPIFEIGEYKIHFVSKNENLYISSNNIEIEILPVPEKFQDALDYLVLTVNEFLLEHDKSFEERLRLAMDTYNEYKGSIYQMELLTDKIYAVNNYSPNNSGYLDEYCKLVKEFILEYPNEYYSWEFFKYILKEERVKNDFIKGLIEQLYDMQNKIPEGKPLHILEIIENRIEGNDIPRLNKILNEN